MITVLNRLVSFLYFPNTLSFIHEMCHATMAHIIGAKDVTVHKNSCQYTTVTKGELDYNIQRFIISGVPIIPIYIAFFTENIVLWIIGIWSLIGMGHQK